MSLQPSYYAILVSRWYTTFKVIASFSIYVFNGTETSTNWSTIWSERNTDCWLRLRSADRKTLYEIFSRKSRRIICRKSWNIGICVSSSENSLRNIVKILSICFVFSIGNSRECQVNLFLKKCELKLKFFFLLQWIITDIQQISIFIYN